MKTTYEVSDKIQIFLTTTDYNAAKNEFYRRALLNAKGSLKFIARTEDILATHEGDIILQYDHQRGCG